MDSINELELRDILKKKPSSAKLLRHLVKALLSPAKTWDEKRVYWHFLRNWGKDATIVHTMIESLKTKERFPFDLFVDITSDLRPRSSTILALLKGLRKQRANHEIINARSWEKWDKRIGALRSQLLDELITEGRKEKQNMLEKFEFLRAQRLTEQAGRVLRRMLELFPNDPHLQKLKAEFEDEWARNVLSTHMTTLSNEKLERMVIRNSPADDEMLDCFMHAGEKICQEHPEFASDLAIGYFFMQEYNRALKALDWAPESLANEWLRVDLLIAARHFVEAMDLLGRLELKYAENPETSFAVNYLKAQCFKELGQKEAALEILQSIVRIRPGYRSAQALIQEWTEGAFWE